MPAQIKSTHTPLPGHRLGQPCCSPRSTHALHTSPHEWHSVANTAQAMNFSVHQALAIKPSAHHTHQQHHPHCRCRVRRAAANLPTRLSIQESRCNRDGNRPRQSHTARPVRYQRRTDREDASPRRGHRPHQSTKRVRNHRHRCPTIHKKGW